MAFAVPAEGYGTPYGSAPGQINCGYYLDELTDDRGPTMVRRSPAFLPLQPGN